ncbi:MAG: hypothetical protein EA378_06505 [Phycisphaerales bacterium]|nr:MAG: hypothetical protein EA378_06505 [Phycisphaerales bacterium]
MTQATYEPGYGVGDAPAGTSVLAILSLISGLLGLLLSCAIVGGAVFGPLALLLGAIALLTKGAKSGGGMAIAGIITGLISIIIAASVAFGLTTAASQVTKYGAVIGDAQRGDVASVRANLSTTANNELADTQITDWGQGAQREWGESRGIPAGVIATATGFVRVANYPNFLEWMQANNPNNDLVPMPMNFENGESIFVIRLDQSSGNVSDAAYVFQDDSGLVWLRAGEQRFAAATPAPPPPADPDPPADPAPTDPGPTDPTEPGQGGN